MGVKQFKILVGGVEYNVQGERMIVIQSGERQAEFCLAPVIENMAVHITNWELLDQGGYCARCGDVTVNLQIQHGYLVYWAETSIVQFDRLVYFPDTTFSGDHWQSYASDSFDRKWEKTLDAEVPLSSAYDGPNPDGADGNGLTDPGDKPPLFVWNIQVRAMSLQTNPGWMGLSLPGAWPVGITRLKMSDERFAIHFEAVRPACSDGKLPAVYFVPGLDGPYDVLDRHRCISDQLELTVKKSSQHPSFWTSPGFKTYLEQWRLSDEARKNDSKASYHESISEEKLRQWIYTVKNDLKLDEMFVVLEQGAYRLYGDYRPVDSLGGCDGLRRIVDQLKADKIHFAYYIHPFMCNTKVDYYKEHPEAFCKPKDQAHETKYSLEFGDDNPEYALVDWTHPLGRQFILDQVEMLIADHAGCLNCDWLRSNHWRSPDPRLYDFYDPDWGIGDLMTLKVQRLLYETVKAIKPHACVSKAGLGDPWAQPYADVVMLAEEWNGWTDNWYRRGRIATRCLRDTIFITDPYFLTITKSYEYYMAMAVWNVIEDPIVEHAIHPYLYFRPLAEKDYRRRKAGTAVQANAPINITDQIHVDLDDDGVDIWRKRTQGPLSGWYASLAFGKRCFATYSETEVRVAASETRSIELPLPSQAAVTTIDMVKHDGSVSPWQAESKETGEGMCLRMRILDAATDAAYFRVRYTFREA